MLSRSVGGGWDGKSMGDLGNMMRLFLELAAPAQRMEVPQRCRMWIKCSAYLCPPNMPVLLETVKSLMHVVRGV